MARPDPPWSSPRERPARTPLSRSAIAAAAVAIVDAEGLEALSMRRLAQALGTGPASLYAHVSGKPELLQLLIDRVAAEIPVPAPEPERWQEQVKDYARGMRRVLAAHRDLAGASRANVPTGPNALDAMEGLLAVLRAGGVPSRQAAYAADLLAQYVTVDVYEGSLFEQRLERDPGYLARLGAHFGALPAERFPTTVSMVGELMGGGGPDARFEFGLTVLVTGLAAVAAATEA